VEPARDPNPIVRAMLEAARSLGIPTFDDHNGEVMEDEGGAAIANVRIRDGRRLSIFRAYTYIYSYMDRRNLTALTGALVAGIVFDGKRAVGVEFLRDSQSHRIAARCEIVLSLGASNTPRVLMQSGVGDQNELARAGVNVVRYLPGVGRTFQDHIFTGCVWGYKTPIPPRNNAAEATFFWKSDPSRRICSRSR
jgi:choline dehydrogenase